jgi:peptidoglycan/LPS O-acetylase OafA/YrhL
VVLFILPWISNNLPAGYNYFLDNRVYYFTYTQNSLFQRDGYPPHWMLSHLWSLAIEEQFYILWPLFIFFLSNRWLLLVMAMIIALSIGLRFANPNVLYTYLSTPTRIDSLMVGGTLAILLLEKKKWVEQWALPAVLENRF